MNSQRRVLLGAVVIAALAAAVVLAAVADSALGKTFAAVLVGIAGAALFAFRFW
jgi:hypothetical protein